MTALTTFREAAIAWAVGGDDEARVTATELGRDVARVILVEGVSDAAAIEALAELRGRDLVGEGVCVIPMGGVTNIAKFLGILGPTGLGIRLAGLCDANEEPHVRRALARFGLADAAPDADSRAGLAAAGFFVCVADLEDELIRALGAERVQQVLEENGDLRAFRVFQNQPAQRTRTLHRHLRRFFGTTAGRKERYGRILVEALDPAAVPQPLDDVLRFISSL